MRLFSASNFSDSDVVTYEVDFFNFQDIYLNITDQFSSNKTQVVSGMGEGGRDGGGGGDKMVTMCDHFFNNHTAISYTV